MANEIKQNLKKRGTWLRALYLLLFVILYGVAELVITAVVVFQFLALLFMGETNARLLKLGQSLSTYVYQVTLFLTFNSDYHPYPLGAWPKGAPTSIGKGTKATVDDMYEKGS